MDKQTLKLIALHESTHCVFARFLNIPVKRISIALDDSTTTFHPGPATANTIERLITFYIAPSIREGCDDGSDEDFNEIDALLRDFTPREKTLIIDRCKTYARTILRQPGISNMIERLS